MQELDSQHIDLITRYLSGNTEPEEIQELEDWVRADLENKAHFQAMKKAWMLSGMKDNWQEVSTEALWEQTSNQLFSEPKLVDMKAKSSPFNWLGVAAAVVVLLIISVFLFQNFFDSKPYLTQAFEEAREIKLSDGSQVVLNQSSLLKFQEENERGQREVALEGDAFFEVSRDSLHPFVIRSQGVEVEVLGTAFYVDAREQEEELQVIVESGRVAVRSSGQEEILQAGEKAVFSKQDQQLSKSKNDDPNFTAIKSKQLVFEGSPMDEVAFVLERQYGVDILFEREELKACPLDGTYEDYELEAILDIIEASLGITYERRGDRISLGGMCNRE
ncbi:MAG: FecR domain-containing protein [Bacteroidota bacterium]